MSPATNEADDMQKCCTQAPGGDAERLPILDAATAASGAQVQRLICQWEQEGSGDAD